METHKVVLEKFGEGPFKRAEKFGWIEWGEYGRYKQIFDKPEIDRSLILDPHLMSFTWMTSVITEIIKETDEVVEFKTKNSHYILKLK